MTTSDDLLKLDRARKLEQQSACGRLLNGAYQRVRDEWGPAFDNLGLRLRRALVSEAILILAAGQDESIAPQTVRTIVERGWLFAVEVTEGQS